MKTNLKNNQMLNGPVIKTFFQHASSPVCAITQSSF